MKLRLLDRSDLKHMSISVNRNKHRHFLKIWHYHEQLELVTILKSTGTRFVGDSIEQFNEGEVVLIGKNLPHMWLNDQIYFEENSPLKAEAIAIHFKDDFLGNSIETMPEMHAIAALLNRSKRGLKFHGDLEEIIFSIKEMILLDDFERVIKFLEILQMLAGHKKFTSLTTMGFSKDFNHSENRNLEQVYSYIFDNFKENIPLSKVANIANMNSAAFSRFFKTVNKKTFTRYLNEIRIGYACKLLLERKYNITDICYESGYNNLSNFNRHFKSIMNHTPTDYVKKHFPD